MVVVAAANSVVCIKHVVQLLRCHVTLQLRLRLPPPTKTANAQNANYNPRLHAYPDWRPGDWLPNANSIMLIHQLNLMHSLMETQKGCQLRMIQTTT